MAVRERARLGAVALGAGAAVLALIQILEQSVSAFSPRPTVSAMITIVVAMVGVTLARARSVSQRRQFLSNVLRWSRCRSRPKPTRSCSAYCGRGRRLTAASGLTSRDRSMSRSAVRSRRAGSSS